MVYTNGDVRYIKATGGDQNADVTFSNDAYCNIGPTNDYYVLNLNRTNYFTDDSVESYDIGISLVTFGYSAEATFEFKYKTLNTTNVNLYYDKDDETGIYTFKYWDERARFVSEIYNENGEVIGFSE